MKHNVTITTENRKEGKSSYCTIAIKGYIENTDAAAEEIKKILDDANRKHKEITSSPDKKYGTTIKNTENLKLKTNNT